MKLRHFVLGCQLPAIFAVCCAGALLGFLNGEPLFAGWLLAAALWLALFWLILFRSSAPRRQLQPQPRQRPRQPDKDRH